MVLPDVNVLVYAHRKDAAEHERYRDWVTALIASPQAYGISELVLSGFVRVVTHPRVFRVPSTVPDALAFASQLRDAPNCVVVSPGTRHWAIFSTLVRETKAKGNLVPDAYLAALAIESGSEWATTDRDYARFSQLRWRHPLESPRGPSAAQGSDEPHQGTPGSEA